MYRFILFDADNTLFDYNRGEAEALKKSFAEFELEYDQNYHLPLYRKFNEKVWKDYEDKLISAENLKTKRFADLFEAIGNSVSEKDFSITYLNKLAESHYLFDGVAELIKEIAPKYKIAIITNGLKEVQYKRIELSAIAEYFDTIIISEEAGAPKPEDKIFSYAFEKANHFDKRDTLIVGDNLKSDIQGGINFGIDTCWFNLHKIEKPKEINPTYEITDINELKRIIQL